MKINAVIIDQWTIKNNFELGPINLKNITFFVLN